MAGFRARLLPFGRLGALWVVCCALAPAAPVLAQFALEPAPDFTGQQVVEVRISGNQEVSLQKINSLIRTRPGRPFDREVIDNDVRKLNQSRMFLQVKTTYEPAPGGVIVGFELVERPILKEIKYLGNTQYGAKKLNEQTDLKVGSALDPYTVDDARQKIEAFYKEKGYNYTTVEVVEGNRPGDRRAVFLVNEGIRQRIKWVSFEGNTIASDARLRTQIQSKIPILWLLWGYVDRDKINADVERLTAYYRGLGYFRATVAPDLRWNEEQSWLSLVFIINEGPRYLVRNVSVTGNLKFPTEDLTQDLELRAGDYFNQAQMNGDITGIKDYYGSKGYILADVQADPRFLEEPGQLDLVYHIAEGDRYRVGWIDPRINGVTGEAPHTRLRTVLNRLSLQPGDIVDTRKLRESERRLKASQLFTVEPAKGVAPKIVITPMTPEEVAAIYGGLPGSSARGQSPDDASPASRDRWLNVGLDGVVEGEAPPPSWSAGSQGPEPGIPSPNRPSGQTSPPQPPLHRGQSPDTAWQPVPTRQPSSNAPESAGAWTAQPPAYPPPGLAAPQRQQAQYTPAPFTPVPTAEPRVVRGQSPASPAAADPWSGYPGYQPYRSPAPSPAAPGGIAPYNAPPPGVYPGSRPLGPAPPAARQIAGPPPAYTGLPPTAPLPAPQPAPYRVEQPLAAPPGGAPPPLEPLAPQAVPPPAVPGLAPVFPEGEPDQFVLVQPSVEEARTGRIMIGVGINSDMGVLGNLVIEEQNFDITRLPRSPRDIIDGTAFRGAGQRLRIEAVPGSEVQRYMINFMEPYLFDTPVSFGVSGFYFDRRYRDWDEHRVGGQVSLGYQLTPDLSATASLRAEEVKIDGERIPTPPELQEVLGSNDVYKARWALVHDTRDSAFLPTEGHLYELAFEQAFGEFDYSRATLEARQFFLISQRPDSSGRQVLALGGQVGISGDDTPLFDHFFAGGTTTIRGFDFRGASPVNMGVRVGGEFMLLASAEYLMPITADDAVRAVFFVDAGTVEEKPEDIDWDDFRVAPGFGLRITVPALGPAPIALDLAFPIARAETDDIENFSFRVGLFR